MNVNNLYDNITIIDALFQKFVDLYCNECHIMICSLCHLIHHENHEFTIIENYSHKIKQEISSKKSSLMYDQNNAIFLYIVFLM